MAKLSCAQCGAPFSVRPSDILRGAKYCSGVCRIDARRKPTYTKVCAYCEKPFDVYPYEMHTRIYCSFDCKCRGRVSPDATPTPDGPLFIDSPCMQCGTVFRASASRLANGGDKYCSVNCAGAARRVERSAHSCKQCGILFERSESAQTKGYCSFACYKAAGRTNAICANCGVVFETFTSKKNQLKYCSKTCHDTATLSPPIRTPCACCGAVFLAMAWKVARNEGKYCSRKCQHTHKRGVNSHTWRGGWKSYYGPDWMPARRAARKRAGYCCERCHAPQSTLPRALAVHHMIPVRCFSNPNDAHFRSNLVALCDLCHGIVEAEGYRAAPMFAI